MLARYYFIVSIIIVFIFNGPVLSDTDAFRMVVIRNDLSVGGEIHLDLETRITDGHYPRTLNSLTVDVTYGDELIEWATDPGFNWAFGVSDGYELSVNKNTGFYRVLVTGNNVNSNGDGTPAGWNVSSSWQRVLSLKWLIQQLAPLTLSIKDNTLASAHFNNLTNEPTGMVTDWTVDNQGLYDPSLAVELASFHAQLDQKGVYLSWVTLNEFQNLGFNVYRSLDSTGPFEKINPKTIAGKGTTTEQQSYSYLDDSAPPNQTLFYMLEQIDTDGSVHRFDHIDISTAGMAIPDQYSLYQNYPNPFNPITTIQYDLPEKAFVRLTVYNTKGERIKTLVSYTQPPGSHKISWDGSTDTGNRAPSGLYFYNLECQNHTDVKKMILTR